jgi:mannitol operon repressor
VAEGARLESVYTLTGIVGSNPTLSASIFNDLAAAPQQSFMLSVLPLPVNLKRCATLTASMDEHQLARDYMKELQKETPRGAVIISGVVLGDLLGKTLENYLTNHKDVKKLLYGGVSAPLGTFSPRILMAFGLRLIDEKEYANLQVIRKIRNHFAHNLHASFDDAKVKDLCQLLDASGFFPRAVNTPARKYNTVATYLAVILAGRPMMSVGRLIGEEGWQNRV